MIGVILWSDEEERKAVVWCEDQGDLAFLDNSATPSGSQCFFDVGDIVRFDLCLEANLRKAHNAHLLEDQTEPHGGPLQPGLMNARKTAKIIPFRMQTRSQDSEERRNAQGA